MKKGDGMNRALYLSEADVKSAFGDDLIQAVEWVAEAFFRREQGDVLLPDKISQIFDEKTQNRINCMPATLISDKLCGVKWVSVFPENVFSGLRNVSGIILLSEIEHGFLRSVMDGAYITGLRTAAVGAVAAKYLARKNSECIGLIGAGREARNHLDLLCAVRPTLKKCYVSSRRETTVVDFIAEEKEKHPNLEFVPCGNRYEEAVRDADIIVTATSTQADLLKADWIKQGALYIHVGGWEDEYAVAKKAQKIVCDEWESVKHRTQTISRMYQEGLLKDEDIYANLGQIIGKQKAGRENETEFIYFCSVGLAFIDVMFAKHIYEKATEKGLGQSLIL